MFEPGAFEVTESMVKTIFCEPDSVGDRIIQQIYDGGPPSSQLEQMKEAQRIADDPTTSVEQKLEAVANARNLSLAIHGDDPAWQAEQDRQMDEAYPRWRDEAPVSEVTVSQAFTLARRWGLDAARQQILDGLQIAARLQRVMRFGDAASDMFLLIALHQVGARRLPSPEAG